MIHTVTPNPALDITHELDALRVGEVNRIVTTREAPGGKGVNVARVIASLERAVSVGGFLGGVNGHSIRESLSALGIEQDWTGIEGATRRTITVVDHSGATVLNEPGPALGDDAWPRLTHALLQRLAKYDVVVLSGSSPPGTSTDNLATLVRAAREEGARVVVDTSGPALVSVSKAGADVVKPNAEELREATGENDPHNGARQLIDSGAGAVVVSCGEDGMLAFVPSGDTVRAWRARPTERLEGNPTGAGDAAVAALACAFEDAPTTQALTSIVSESLREAVALSGAAVLRPAAGEIDIDAYHRMRHEITLEELHATC